MFKINKLIIFCPVVLLVLLMSWSGVAGRDNAGGGCVTGVVTAADGAPLVGASIIVPGLNKAVPTDIEGRFVLCHLPAGPVLVEVSHVGYASTALEVNASSAALREYEIILKESALKGRDIVVTGSPTAVDPQITPQDIQVLGGEKLAAVETASLGKVLEGLPGVSNLSTGPQAGKPVIRGLSGNRIRVLKDGVPMEHYQFSFRHQPVLNLSQAERVEIVQGGAGILYGSDALGGAANVITKALPAGNGGHPYLNGLAKGQYFSNNRERSGSVELEGATNAIGYRAGFNSRRADNFKTPDEPTFAETGSPGDPKFTGELPHTNFEQYSGYALVGLSGSFGNLQALYDHYDSEQNYLLADGSPVGQSLKNDNFKVKGNFPVSAVFMLKPTLSYQRNVRRAVEGAGYDDDPDWAVDLVRSVYVARLDLAHENWRGLNGTVGFDLNFQDQNTRASGLLPDATVFDIGLFAFEEYTMNDLTLDAGLRFDYRENDAEANEAMRLPDREAGETDDVLTQSYSVLSGSLGAGYRLTENLTLVSNMTAGFRAPDIFELHAFGIHGGVLAFQIGNPYLDPERSYGIDFGVRLRTERAAARATLYYNRIDNYIYMENQGRDTTVGGSTLPILAAGQTDGTISGVELSGEAELFSWLKLDAAYSAAVSDNKATGEELPLMPADRLVFGSRFSKTKAGPFHDAFAEMRMKYVRAKESAGTYEPFSQFDEIPFGTASTDAYTIFSLALGVTFNLDNRPVFVSLEAENLFDRAYVDFLDTYKGYALAMGRNISLRIQIPFSML